MYLHLISVKSLQPFVLSNADNILALVSVVTDTEVVPDVVDLDELSVVSNVSSKDQVLLTKLQDCDPLAPKLRTIVQANTMVIVIASTL